MKGPGLRLLIDVRRTWKCPRCGYEEHVGAEVTTVRCPCCPGVYMKLCESRKVHADELKRLRERPMPIFESVEAQVDGLPLVEMPPSESAAPTAAAADSPADPATSPPAKRRGKRPRKQSRRGQHKQQAQTARPPSDSEE